MALDIVSYILGLQTLGGGGKGGSVPFKSLTLGEDGSYTVVDRKDREHILEVEEESGQIVGITYDGKEIALEFDDDEVLTQIGEAIIDIGEYPEPPLNNVGYLVAFKVNDNNYYIASCQQGESITEPPTPTVEGVFLAWQLNGVDVMFPYTPSADVELTASIATVHTEIEVNTAGEQLYSYSGNTVTKSNNGMALFGFVTYQTTQKFLFLVSQTQNAVTMSDNQMTSNSITYNGETWYFAHSRATMTTAILHEAADVGTFESSQGAPDIAKRILDYYYNV